jgi:hypothetical protein
MQRTKSVHLKRIRWLDQRGLENLLDALAIRFNTDKGFGFFDTEYGDSVITSTLIYQSIVYQRVLDFEAGILAVQEQVSFEQVPFQIDLGSGLLQADVGGKRLSKLLSVLGQVFEFRIAFDDIYCSIEKFIIELDKTNWIYNIISTGVDNFRPTIGLSGRFVASVDEQQAARRLIETYSVDVTDITIELIDDQALATLRLASQGKVAVRAEEEQIDKYIKLFNSIILRCCDA